MRKLMVAAAVLLAIAGLSVVAIVVVAIGWGAYATASYTHEDRPATAPLVEMSITRRHGKTAEIYAELADGVRIADIVDVAILRGLSDGMTDDSAVAMLGRASGKWMDPLWETESSYYDVPLGRISLARVRGEYGHLGWATMAYPTANHNDLVIRDKRLLTQLLPLLDERRVDVTLRQAGTPELRVSLYMTRTSCPYVHLLMGSL
jgi:hypothetical protein